MSIFRLVVCRQLVSDNRRLHNLILTVTVFPQEGYMYQKTIALCLAMSLAALLGACGDGAPEGDADTDTDATEETQPVTEEETPSE